MSYSRNARLIKRRISIDKQISVLQERIQELETRREEIDEVIRVRGPYAQRMEPDFDRRWDDDC